MILPILKNGKDPKRRESYRPVSLTSVCVKVLERMIECTEQMAIRFSERKEHRATSGESGAIDSRWVKRRRAIEQ